MALPLALAAFLWPVVVTGAVQVQVGETGIILAADAPTGPLPILSGLGFRAVDDQGVVFETAGATMEGDDLVTFAVRGPGAGEATVSGFLSPRLRGFSLDCSIRWSGGARSWNPWSSGFRFAFGSRVTDARTQAVTRWVAPTGAQPWEVPGDTPYPETECQLREVFFGNTALVMVSSIYDPDWIYGNNLERAGFSRIGLPTTGPWERKVSITFLAAPADDLEPAALAAEAAGRSMALTVATNRVGNLFEPGEPVSVACHMRNVTSTQQRGTLSVEAWSYQGECLLKHEEELTLAGGARQTVPLILQPRQRGVVFVASRLNWGSGEVLDRTTLGILPARRSAGTLADSPFGMAAIIANPRRYPDQFDMDTVLGLMERVGVRRLRGGWMPFGAEFSEGDDRDVRETVDALTRHGILPHVQIGQGLPEPGDVGVFTQRFTATLSRYGWVSPYVEVGNELNLAGVRAREYVERMLRPIARVTRQVRPEGKVMSMGLGGVNKDWLADLVAAGGMELLDVLSVHPGCQPRAPEFWEGWRGWVFRSQMLDAMRTAREHGGKEVWITEAYAPTPPDRSGVDLRTSADYLVRTYVCALALGVKVIEWYQFQDGVWFARRQEPSDVEYNFGIVYADLSPKPAYVAFGTMTEQLEGARYQGRLDLGADDLYGVRFRTDGQPVDVLWSYREKHETDLPWWPPENYRNDSRRPAEPWVQRWRQPVTVQLPAAGTVTVTDIMGNVREVTPQGGTVHLELTGSPVYVRGLGAVPERARFWEDIP